MRTVNSYIGAGVPRLEDRRFLRGAGQYVGDLSLPGMLHAVVLRSPVAHGRIRSIDASVALAMPGVHAVFTASDIGVPVPRIPMRQEAMPEIKPFEQPVIAEEKVRYAGEPVAVIVAVSQDTAEDALAAIVLDIDTLPAALGSEVTALLYDGMQDNIATTLAAVKGDADAAFSAHRGYTRRERFKVQRHTAVPMEARGLVADWDTSRGEMTLYGAAKVAFTNRRILARHMGLPENKVRLVENDVGGAFGARGEFYPEDFLIPFASRRLGRPVKWLEDRRENLAAMNHAREAECELEIACEPDGTIVAIRGHVIADIGAYVRTVGVTPARNIVQVLSGPYRTPHVHLGVSVLMTNKTPSGTYRGPGRFEADFFRERMFDMIAADLGMDRVAFRRKNLIAAEEMPYPLATLVPINIESATDSGDYRETLDRCLVEFGWAGKQDLNGRLVEGRYHGVAVGCYFEGGAGGPRENVRLVLEQDGTFSLYAGSSGVGQGLETVLAQIAADALECPMDRIANVFHGSTDHVTEGFGSYSSRTVVMAGSAIADAGSTMRAVIRAAAAERMGCAENEVELGDGVATGPDRRSVRFADLAGLSADGTFVNNKRTYSYGAHAVHVAVDPETGHIELVDYTAVEDVGRIVNPHTLHGQTMGAIVQGLGGTLMEHLIYSEDGQLMTATLADYYMPLATDIPHIHAVALENHPSPLNPMGFKGAGEGGIIPVGGVVANAVAMALSSYKAQPYELPLSPVHVWRMMQGTPSS